MLTKICDSYWADLSAFTEIGVGTLSVRPNAVQYSVEFTVSGVTRTKAFDKLEDANKFAKELVERVNSVD